MEILSNWILWASVIGAVVLWKLIETVKGTIDKARQNQQGVIDDIWNRISKLEFDKIKTIDFIGRPKDYKWSDPSLQTQINVLSDRLDRAATAGMNRWQGLGGRLDSFSRVTQDIVLDHAKALDALEAKVKELQEAQSVAKPKIATTGTTETVQNGGPSNVTVRKAPLTNPTSSRRTR